MFEELHNLTSGADYTHYHSYTPGNLPGDLFSNEIPTHVKTSSHWQQENRINKVLDSFVPEATARSVYKCLNHFSDDLTYEEQEEYSTRCLQFYYLEGNTYNHSAFNSQSPEEFLKILVQPNFDEDLTHINMTNLVAYSVLFPLAAVGNLLVLIALFKSRHRKSRVNLMILHLSLADMIVAFIFLPMEITWQITIQWKFGTVGCKIYKFFSAFGFYMSSMVLVCISLDRYFAVLHPLRVNDAQRRGKIMLFFAWVISAFISLPQSIVFSVESHPQRPSFQQCVSFGFFDGIPEALMVYTIFCIFFLYFLPLTIILVAYTRIIVEISKKSKETQCEQNVPCRAHLHNSVQQSRSRMPLRRSNVSSIERARTRTLRMTFIIVMAFIWCWTPYALGTLWNFIDSASFMSMNKHLQDVLFILAVSNSVVNPLIYGRYSIPFCRNLMHGRGAARGRMLRMRPQAASARDAQTTPAVRLVTDPPKRHSDKISFNVNPGDQSVKPVDQEATGSYEDDDPPASDEANEAIEVDESGNGSKQRRRYWCCSCWCCCNNNFIHTGFVTCKTTGICNGSPPATRSTTTLYTHATRDRMMVKLLSFLHDFNRPEQTEPLAAKEDLAMIPMSVLQPARLSQIEVTRANPSRVTAVSTTRPAMNKKCAKRRSRGRNHRHYFSHWRETTNKNNVFISGYDLPEALKYGRGVHDVASITGPVYHMKQQGATLRYSPARLAMMLQRKPHYHKRAEEGACGAGQPAPGMLLHVNDCAALMPPVHGDSILRIRKDMDSYEESSGYSSSHAHVRSCHDVGGNVTSMDDDLGIWEKHNSC